MLYTNSIERISPEMLKGFFVGWPKAPNEKTHLQLLRNSSNVVLAIDEAQNRVVGFITAISDGILSAYIPFLEVLPNYQNRGIGKELTERMFAQLENIYMVDLCCDDSLVPYYEKLGMLRSNGMLKRNYNRQSGQ